MSKTHAAAATPPLVLDLRPVIDMTDEQFYLFCQANPDLRIERTAEGEIIVMAPAGGATGHRNADLTAQLQIWAKRQGEGIVFDSSTGFNLPNGATRAPDAAWIRRTRLAVLAPEEKERFLPLCPDFVVELCSPSDRLQNVQEKMQEYIDNGARLGWLIEPQPRSVYVYRPQQPMLHLQDPATLSGDPILPGFVLDLATLWEPGF